MTSIRSFTIDPLLISSHVIPTEEDVFQNTPLAAEDAIFALTAMFKADPSKDKVSCGVGAYRDNQGLPYVLPVVRKVSRHLLLSLSWPSEEDWRIACVK